MNETLDKDIKSPNLPQSSILSDAGFLNDLRRQMVKSATLQLSDSHHAEDALQEAPG
jgi:hypothetical protein